MKISTIDQMIELSNGFKGELKAIGINVNPNWLVKIYPNSVNFVLTEDSTMTRVFGGEIDVYYDDGKGYLKNGESFKLSAGSMGTFDMECVASVEKYLLMADLIKNFPVFKALSIQFMNLTK